MPKINTNEGESMKKMRDQYRYCIPNRLTIYMYTYLFTCLQKEYILFAITFTCIQIRTHVDMTTKA
ncbi:hypothetical protein ACW2QC_11545 [Virgibacillus sp. FSP13]